MKASVRRILEEAIRRWLSFGANKSLETAWTGLGYESEYRPAIEAGLMQWVDKKPVPRQMLWLKLTPAGVEAVRGMMRERICPDYKLLPIPTGV